MPLQNLEFQVIHKDGHALHCISKPTRLMIDGKTLGFQAIIIDITERKKAEKALRESEEKNRKTIENANVGIITYGLEGEVKVLNPKMEEITGFKRTEIPTLVNWFEKLYPNEEERRKVRDKWFKRMSGEGEVKEGHATITTKEGKRRNFLFNAVQLKSGDSIAFAHDITERKQMEEKLKQYSEQLEALVQKRTKELSESQKNYSVLVEEASDGVAILQDGKIVFTNKKGTEIIGYSKDEIAGLPFGKLVSEKYRQLTQERYAQRLRGENIPSTYELELISKNGTQVPVELSATRIQYQSRPADLLLVRDISERKRMEEQRSKLERLAAIGEIAGMVGHDLRNPLTGIKNAAY
jgi:PAS domain S-box-containing protein